MEDYLYSLLHLYKKLPYPVKRIMGAIYNLIPRSRRYGKFYNEYLSRISFFYNLKNVNEVKLKQQELLFRNVSDAISSIPFYKNYPHCKSISDFEKLPIINKSIIVDSMSEMVNPKLSHLKLKAFTGGSSGTPMFFYIEKNKSRSKEKAHFDWYWRQFGYKMNSRIMMLRGSPLPNGRSFEYNAIDNILNISCFNINENSIALIIKEINNYKPEFIHGYPSSVKIITQLLEKHKDQLSINIKALFLGSEHLYKNDRSYFESFYKAKVVNWYGHTEKLIHGGNCKFSNEFHFYPGYGLIELLDDNDKPVTQPGEEGRIVATGFDNKVMPFIRYDTDDKGILSGITMCKCGFKGLSLKEITGRDQDVIVLSDNTKVSVTAFITRHDLDAFARIREMQLRQERAGELEIRVVKNQVFPESDKAGLVNILEKSVDHKLKVQITFVDHIPKTQRGKNIFFVSSLNQIESIS